MEGRIAEKPYFLALTDAALCHRAMQKIEIVDEAERERPDLLVSWLLMGPSRHSQ